MNPSPALHELDECNTNSTMSQGHKNENSFECGISNPTYPYGRNLYAREGRQKQTNRDQNKTKQNKKPNTNPIL